MTKHYVRTGLVALAAVAFSLSAQANDKACKPKGDDKKTLAELLDGTTAHAGLINIHRHAETGCSYLVLDKAQLDTPVLHIATTVDGVVDAGHFRGAYRQTQLVSFRKHFNRIDIVAKTPRFYFDPSSAISKAADANISEALLVTGDIVAQDDTRVAMALSDVVLSESLHKVSPYPNPDPEAAKQQFKLGKLSKSKSRIATVSNFPLNTHVVVDYVFENPAPPVGSGPDVTDPRFVSVSLQHAFVAVPENGYQPRRDDPRLGYFAQHVDDLTSDESANYRDVINRWHLVKQDPSAAVSDPVQPIVWWIENTTPLEWRDTIRDATLAWNSAFEKAGFSNAIQVKVQPDNATWSADDVRYNVLRWTSSPRPPFGGYGPSVAHPETGQIIAADIMLEYTFMKGRWINAQLFTSGHNVTQMLRQPAEMQQAVHRHCQAGRGMNMNLLFGQTAALARGMDDLDKDKMLRQSMYFLILHEVGHTLGLNHNMRASQLFSPAQLHDDRITQGIVLGSVMDYPAINFAPPGQTQGDYYNEKPGPYDDWVIEYGYSPALDNPADEARRLDAILARSMDPRLAFGNDADDMRAAGRHIDPRVNIFDQSGDAVAYARGRFALVRDAAPKLPAKLLGDGRSHHDLLVGANVLMVEMTRQANVVSRYIGGVQVERAMVGQPGYKQPFLPVPEAQQKAAMAALAEYLFAPDAVDHMQPLYAYLQKQRRGFASFGDNEDPKLHDMLLAAQQGVLDHLLHVNVLRRISDSALYGNTYALEQVLADLTDAVFAADRKSDVNSFRRNLQVEYVDRLIAVAGLEQASPYDHLAQAVALYELDRLQGWVKSRRGDQATQVHRFYLRDRIDRAFHKSRT